MIRLLPAALLLLLAACSSEIGSDANAAEPAATRAPSTAMPADAETMEVGCYGCVFEAEGAQGCQLAVMVDGEPVLVEGVAVGAHALGLCEGSKQARIAGERKGDTFVATAFSVNE